MLVVGGRHEKVLVHGELAEDGSTLLYVRQPTSRPDTRMDAGEIASA